ncbi:tetratricopeptide repeat protein [Kordiimonas sp.]|uniref:tetratricopeptide repeat protein n=1 Tax=Kordiimonas sp. TaxID=1970157 RepID=UPI003A942EBF
MAATKRKARNGSTQAKAAGARGKAVSKAQKAGLADTNLSIKEVKVALKKGQQHAANQEWPEAVTELLKAWEALPEDINILTILAHALTQLGVREQAIYVLERALHYHKPTPDVCSVIQNLALDMGFHEIAEKLGHQLVAMDPKTIKHYINLFTALNRQEKYDQTIEMAQQMLPMFPDSADMWNVLATSVKYRDGKEASIVFYEEALRLDPKNHKVLCNLAGAIADQDVAQQYLVRALEVEPLDPEVQIASSMYLFRNGRLEEAWKYYKSRLSSRRVQTQQITYTHRLPEWDGQSSLKDKVVLAACEQGIGDEVMFGLGLREIEKHCKQLVIGVDHRLVKIYQRAFPDAIVTAYRDGMLQGYRYRAFPEVEGKIKRGELHVDYAMPFATILQHFWHQTSDVKFPDKGYLGADPAKSNEWRDRIEALGPGLKVGVTWQSGTVSAARQFGYLKLDDLLPILSVPGVQFVNMQYSDVSKQVEEFTSRTGIKLHRFEDVNLKADIDANLSIMEHLDLVIGPAMSTQVFAASINRPVWWLTLYKPWWSFGADEGIPWAPKGRYFPRFPDKDWKRNVADVAAALKDRVAKHGKA